MNLTVADQVNLLARDVRSIRHDLARLVHSDNSEHNINMYSLKDAVDFIDGALIVMEGIDNE